MRAGENQGGRESETKDDELVEAARRGDDGAFSRLVARYKPHVFRLAAHFARHPHELDDICQEVFIKAYERLGTYRRESPFEHWLSRITIHTCRDALRKTRRDRRHLPLEELPFELQDTAREARDEAREAYETLMWGMAGLRPDERVVLTLLELEEKTVREVAALTGWSEGNVRVRAHRARGALRRILEEHHEP